MADDDFDDDTVRMPHDQKIGGGDTNLHDVLPTVVQDRKYEPTVPHSRGWNEQSVDEAGQVATPISQVKLRKAIGIFDVVNDRFVLESLLGRGGMGTVYRALDRRKKEADDRNPYVAIKILNDDFKHHPKAFVALQQEASKSQMLAHPNIVTVFDFDRDGDIVYMTMEQLSGISLRDLIKSNPRGVAPAKATEIILQMARGLAYAHSNGIVHADLKPGNVFLTDTNTVKVLDFGIARAVSAIDQKFSERPQFDAGELGGLTPAYASYEMLEDEDPDPSDDVYALGLIAYELFTGSHPFDREPANRARKIYKAPERIKHIRQREWNAVRESLAFDRADRIHDATQFLKKFNPNKRVPVLAASLLVAAFFAGATFFILQTENVGPEIPFEELAIDVQQQIESAIANGKEALSLADINGALFYLNTAYELHPRNEKAVEGLDTVVKRVLSDMRVNNMGRDRAEKLVLLNDLLEYPALAENAEILEARAKLQEND